jgi:hypothetical protein
VQFTNANPYYLETPHPDKDGDKAAVFFDRDGAVTGSAGSYVVPNSPFLTTPACALRAEWNAYVCPNRYIGFSVRSDAGAVAPLTVVRDGAVSLDLVGVPGNPDAAFATVLPDHPYALQFSAGSVASPKLYLDNVAAGEWMEITLPYAQAPAKMVRDYWAGNPVGAVGSLAELQASSGDKYYYDAVAGQLHIKLMPMPDRDWATMFVD